MWSDSRSTYSSGLWAPPPRGPRPSIVSGTCAAMWLGTGAPPRFGARRRRPHRPAALGPAGRAAEQRRWLLERLPRLLAGVHPGPLADQLGLERHAADVGRH